MKVKIDHNDKFLLFLCAANVIFRLPFASMPAFWDEINYTDGVIAITKHNLNPFVYFWGYKPPVMFMLPAFLFRFVSQSLIWERLLIYMPSSVALFLMYRLGSMLFNKRIGFQSALLLFFYPLFMTQSFLYQDPVPFTVLFLAAIYYYFSQNIIGYIIASSLLVLTKEPGVFLPIALFVYDLSLRTPSNNRMQNRIAQRITILLPVLILTFWMLLNKLTLGWYVFPYNISLFTLTAGVSHIISPVFIHSLYSAFINYFVWPVFCGCVCLLITKAKTLETTGQKKLPIVWLFTLLFIGYFLFYLTGLFNLRYILQVYPLVFILFVAFLLSVAPNRKTSNVIVAIMCIAFLLSNFITAFVRPTNGNYDESFAFLNSISLTQRVVCIIDERYSSSVILTPWPLDEQLTQPLFGYVTTPLRVIDRDNECVQNNHLDSQIKMSTNEDLAKYKYSSLFYLYSSYRYYCTPPSGSVLKERIHVNNNTQSAIYDGLYLISGSWIR